MTARLNLALRLEPSQFLARWPALQQFQKRVAERPKVHAAMKAEGLVKDPAPAAA